MTDQQRPGQCTHPDCTDDAHYDAPTIEHVDDDGRINTVLGGPHVHCYRHRTIDAPARPVAAPSGPIRTETVTELEAWATRAGRRLADIAGPMFRPAIDHAAHALVLIDSLPTETPGAGPAISEPHVNRCRYCATTVQAPTGELVTYSPGCEQCRPIHLTPAERAAEQRLAITSDITEAGDLRIAIDSFTDSLIRILARLARTPIPTTPTTCDGSQLPTAHVRWIPHSRHPNNGWYDPTCTRPAVRNGLCEPCSKRHDRYTTDHEVVQTEHAPSPAPT